METINWLWKAIIEIFILWYIHYILFLFLRGTRAFNALKGLLILAVLYLVTEKLNLYVINWLLTKLFALSVIGFLVIFHPELRRGLARIGGQNEIFEIFLKDEEVVEELVQAIVSMSQRKIGSIIAIERQVSLLTYVESGLPMDSKITKEIIWSIFITNGPLHDGGVILSSNRIQAAGCLFPLTQDTNVSKTLGTRHRAAIGLTEETDALCIVTSEETGAISIAIGGKLTRDLDKETLSNILKNLLCAKKQPEQKGKFWKWAGKKK